MRLSGDVNTPQSVQFQVRAAFGPAIASEVRAIQQRITGRVDLDDE